MKLKEVENEKDHYFSKLSQLDEFLSQAQSSDDAQSNPILLSYL